MFNLPFMCNPKQKPDYIDCDNTDTAKIYSKPNFFQQ